jgi:hypothetical protein
VAVKQIAQLIQHLKLKGLNLNFGGALISNLGLTAIAESIRAVPELKSCDLSLVDCSVINELGINNLIAAIGSLSGLTELALWFTGCSLTNQNLEQLGNALGQLKHLTKLYLNLRSCEQISDRGIDYLANNLINLHELAEFSICLPKNGNTTQSSLALSNACQQLIKLALPEIIYL